MIANIAKIIVTLLAGVGGGAILDKVAADKLPSYPSGGVTGSFKTETGAFDIPKIAWFVASAVVVTLALKFIGKKFNIKILK